MPDIYLCGHGGWGVIGHASIFVQVPSGTEIVFYRDIGNVLYVSEAEAILRRAANALKPARVVTGFQQCPDMSLYPANEFWPQFSRAAGTGGVNWHAAATETKLDFFLMRYPGCRLHWIACGSRQLRK